MPGVPAHARSNDFGVIMALPFPFRVAALALLPAAAIAQQVQQPDPGDPGIPVPAPAYVSAFDNDRSPSEDQAAPDTVWRAANEELAKRDAHAGHGGMSSGMPNDMPPPASRPGPAASHGSHHH
jgi:hypothetical protein